MASRRQDLETRIIAKDDASKVIDKVADELDTLEKKDTTIDLKAEDHASAEVKSLSQLLAGLSDEDKTVVLNAKVGDAERNIDRILRSLRDVDKMDQQEIDVRVEMLGDARAELDRVQDELRQVDGSTAEVHVEATGLDDILDKVDLLPGKFGELGGLLKGGGGVAAGAAAVAGSLVAAAVAAEDTAIAAETMAKLTGASVEESSKLQSIWKTTGADVNDLNDIVVQLNGALEQSPELASKIGVNLGDGRNAVERLIQVFDLADKGLISMTDQSTLFGEEGIRQVAALTASYDDLAGTIDRMPAPVTEEDAAKARELKNAMVEVQTTIDQLVLTLGEAMIPLLQDAAETANEILGPLVAVVDKYEDFRDADQKKDPSFLDGLKSQAFRTLPGVFDDFKSHVDDLQDGLGAATHGTADIADETTGYNTVLQESVQLAIAQGRETAGVTRELEEQNQLEKSILATERDRNQLKQQQVDVYNVINAAVVEYYEGQRAAREEQIRVTTQILETDNALEDLAGTFEQIGTRQDALNALFDLQNRPLDVAGQVRDISLAIEDLDEAAKDVDLSQPLDPANLGADKLLDALDSLRPQIQQQITDTFSAGGEEAAIAMANDYIAKVAEELDIPPEEAAKLLGLEDITATIHVAVEQSDVDNARSQLEILTGISGETPWTASIALALDAGTISGEEAQRRIQTALKQHGVTIPAELVPGVTPAAANEGKRQVDEVANPGGKGRHAAIEPGVDPEKKRGAKQDLDDTAKGPGGKPRTATINPDVDDFRAARANLDLDNIAHDRYADVYVTIHYPDGTTATATPTSGGGGAPGGLSVGPTALGAAPTVAATSTSSGGGGFGPFTVPVAAPSRSQQPVIQNLYFQQAVLGGSYDVMRAVEDAGRRAARLLPGNT